MDVCHFGVGVLDVLDAEPGLLRRGDKNALLLSDAGCFSHYRLRRRFRDHYGAVVIPESAAEAVVTEAARIAKQERILITAAQQPGFSIKDIEDAYAKMADIH